MKQTMRKGSKWILSLILIITTVVCAGAGIQAQTAGPSIISISVTIKEPSESPPSPANAAPGSYFDAEVSIQVTGFRIVDKLGQTNVPGEGHIIYYNFMGLANVPTALSEPAFPPQDIAVTAYRSTSIPFLFVNNLPGTYTYAAQLVNNDDTPLSPPVLASITTNQGTAFPGPVPTQPTTGAVMLDLIASSTSFDKNSLAVPPGAQVTLTLNNQDEGVLHNFSVYTDSTASTAVFHGSGVRGPATMTYTFNAPVDPGEYYFRCDFHPQMNGVFLVAEAP